MSSYRTQHAYVSPGMRHFLDAEARALGLADGPENQHPVAMAAAIRPISLIGSHVTQASWAPDDAARVAILAHCEGHLQALSLARAAAEAALVAAYEGFGLALPEYLDVPPALDLHDAVEDALRDAGDGTAQGEQGEQPEGGEEDGPPGRPEKAAPKKKK